MPNQNKQERYLGQRCENHPDFFPDECGCYVENKQEPEGDLKTVVRKFANSLAFQLSPSNDTMEAIRLLTQELPALLHQEREKAVRETEKAFGGCKNCYGKGYATTKVQAGAGGKVWELDPIKPCNCERGNQIKSILDSLYPTNKTKE